MRQVPAEDHIGYDVVDEVMKLFPGVEGLQIKQLLVDEGQQVNHLGFQVDRYHSNTSLYYFTKQCILYKVYYIYLLNIIIFIILNVVHYICKDICQEVNIP